MIPIIAELIRKNPGTISLGQGVVSYPPPPESIEHLQRFFQKPNHHKYQPVDGLPELREALGRKLHEENGISLFGSNALLVTAGGNMAFMNAVLAIADPGDEIILLSPYYFNHEMAVTIAGCHPVIVPTDGNYQIDLEQIRKAITAKTRAVVTVSPNNPTGAVYPEASLRAVNELCAAENFFHISDEAYEYFTYEGAAHFSPGSMPGSEGHTISLYSLSKAYGFASWRIGYMVVPHFLLTAIKKIQDTILICPPVISQFAAMGALVAGRAYCSNHLLGLDEIRKMIKSRLEEISELCCIPPSLGAFYFFLKINTKMDSMVLARRLIEEEGVAALPGSTFGMDECSLRISYGALDANTAQEGVGRLIAGLKKILK